MVDAFSGFTAQELEVLSLVLRQAKETVISVCVDQDPAKDNGMGLFSPVKKPCASSGGSPRLSYSIGAADPAAPWKKVSK